MFKKGKFMMFSVKRAPFSYVQTATVRLRKGIRMAIAATAGEEFTNPDIVRRIEAEGAKFTGSIRALRLAINHVAYEMEKEGKLKRERRGVYRLIAG